MKRVIMTGRLGPRGMVVGLTGVGGEIRFVKDGAPELVSGRIVPPSEAEDWHVRRVRDEITRKLIAEAHPDELMPRVGDVVRFRYTPNDLEVMSVKHTHEGAIAVVHQMGGDVPQGGFAAHVRDLRIVKRLTTD